MKNQNEEKQEKKLDRRQFLGLAWLTTGLVFVGETLGALFKYVQPVIDGGFGGVVKAGTLEEFPPGSITLVQEGRFFLSRLDDGSFIALWQRCTHLGCSVPWVEDEEQFHCPCHGSLFNNVGVVQGGPAPRPLDYFPVSVEGGEVFVNTEEAFERAEFDVSQTTKA